jgi:hypothetical protein
MSCQLHHLTAETPTMDCTWKTTPTTTTFGFNQNGLAINAAKAFNGDLEVYGTGTLYLSGTSKGTVQFEGATPSDGHQILLSVDEPSHNQRAIVIPNVVGDSRIVVSAHASTDGPAAWASVGTACSAACTDLLGSSATCNDSILLTTGTSVGNCSSTTGIRMCECY